MALSVQCQKRAEKTTPNGLRRNGLIPAVLYGHNGAESVAITLEAKAAEQLVKKASVNNTLINVDIPDISWSGKTILREVQTHSAKGNIYHLSFFSVAAHGAIEVEIPLHFVGEAKGVKLNGGMLDTVISTLAVKCVPDSIPERIDVDVTDLGVGDALHINQLNLPAGVTPIAEGGEVVVSVLNPQGGSSEDNQAASA